MSISHFLYKERNEPHPCTRFRQRRRAISSGRQMCKPRGIAQRRAERGRVNEKLLCAHPHMAVWRVRSRCERKAEFKTSTRREDIEGVIWRSQGRVNWSQKHATTFYLLNRQRCGVNIAEELVVSVYVLHVFNFGPSTLFKLQIRWDGISQERGYIWKHICTEMS